MGKGGELVLFGLVCLSMLYTNIFCDNIILDCRVHRAELIKSLS